MYKLKIFDIVYAICWPLIRSDTIPYGGQRREKTEQKQISNKQVTGGSNTISPASQPNAHDTEERN